MAYVSATSKNTYDITCTLLSLDTSYSYSDRTVKWYYNSVLKGTSSTIPAYASSGGSYKATGLTPSTTYSISAKVYKGATLLTTLYGTATTASLPPPPPPPAPTLTRIEGGLRVSWATYSGATKYELAFTKYSGTNYVGNITTTSQDFTALENSVQYTVKLNAYVNGAFVGYSSGTVMITNPDTPSIYQSTITASSINIGTGAVDGAFDEIQVERYSSANVWQETRFPTESSSTLFTGLTAGTLYKFKARTKATISGSVLYSPYTGIISITTSTVVVPATPTGGVIAGVKTSSSIALSWGALANALTYSLKYKRTVDSTWIEVVTSGTTYNLTGLVADTSYDFKYCGINGSTYSLAYSWVSVATTLVAGAWAWNPAIVQGGTVVITASQWLSFQAKINQVRVNNGLSAYSFTTSGIVSGQPITALSYRQCAIAIDEINGQVVDSYKSVQTGDTLLALHITNITAALNNAIG